MPSKSGTLYSEESRFLNLTRGRENALSIDQERSGLKTPQSISVFEGGRIVTISNDEVLVKNYDNALRRERAADKREELEGILDMGLGKHEVAFLSKLGKIRDRFTSSSDRAVSKKTSVEVTEDQVIDTLSWLIEIRGHSTPIGVGPRMSLENEHLRTPIQAFYDKKRNN